MISDQSRGRAQSDKGGFDHILFSSSKHEVLFTISRHMKQAKASRASIFPTSIARDLISFCAQRRQPLCLRFLSHLCQMPHLKA